jgi:CRP-like cAMP-binding protein
MNAKAILHAHVAKSTPLSDDQFDYFFSHFKPLLCKKGQVLIAPGKPVEQEYFVLDGCLKSFYRTDQGKTFILQFAMPTWWASDYEALYNGTPATTQLDCITASEVLCLASADREKLCKEVHAIESFFRWRTNRGYVAAQKRLLSFMHHDARQRYEELLRLYPQLYNVVPKQLIAAYIGVSRETLSRLYQP